MLRPPGRGKSVLLAGRRMLRPFRRTGQDDRMKCPNCASPDTRVINSRPANAGESIRRRRECPVCQTRFTTYEIIEKAEMTVIKRNGSTAPYSRERLQHGIEKACRKRPVSAAQIEALVNGIERDAFQNPHKEVTTEQLGRLVLKRLKEIDQVAYLRFASVYKQFRDLHDFNTEIRSLLKD